MRFGSIYSSQRWFLDRGCQSLMPQLRVQTQLLWGLRQLPRAQYFNCVRSAHSRPSHISPERRTRTSISLLEELFPEEARPDSTPIPGSQNVSKPDGRQIPRLKLPADPNELDKCSENRTLQHNNQPSVHVAA